MDFDLSKGTSKYLDQATWVRFEGPIVINESRGWSHRWKFVFKGKPKFLSCYFLEDGRPIRPSHDNLEKLLYPKGIQKGLDDYLAAVISMVVDNVFNDHNINHMKHRYIIANQIKRIAIRNVSIKDVLKLCRLRSVNGSLVPYPMVCESRRQEEYVDLDSHRPVAGYVKEFNLY